MAFVSSSVNPLAMRSITVEGRLPDLKSCIAVTSCAASRPASRGTVVSTERAAGWQPEQELAPGGASAADAMAVDVRTMAAAATIRVLCMADGSLHFGGPRGPPSGLPQIMVLQRQRTDALAGRGEDRVAERRRHDRHRWLAAAAPEAAALDDDRIHLRHLGETDDLVVVEVRLLDAAAPDGDLAIKRGTESIRHRAVDLHVRRHRIDHMP